MGIATGMRFVQNVLAATHLGPPVESDDLDDEDA